MTRKQPAALCGALLVWAYAAVACHAAILPLSNIVSSNAGLTPFDGLPINALIGSDAFYNQGFFGDTAIVANIESGHIWNGHETLAHVTTFIQDTVNPGPQTGEFDYHATAVGQMIGGRPTHLLGNYYQVGVAPNATLWSGSIATKWTGAAFSGGFEISLESMLNVYKKVLLTGVSGQTADVTNSSWGDSSDTTGSEYGDISRGVDAINRLAKKIVVFSAGNYGPGPNTIGVPASGYNVITVGALDADLDAKPYAHVASFSSRGPNDVFVPFVQNVTDIQNPLQGIVIPNARARVDLVAPGENLTVAFYGGPTGQNSPTLPGGGALFPAGNDYYLNDFGGTSFSAPIVAGAASLLVDAAKWVYGGSTKALDGRVMKAMLLTGADKNLTAGWSNGAVVLAGVLTTTQSLDYVSGAGRLNLTNAYSILLTGTSDVAGLGGGNVQKTGWDFGQVAPLSPNDYYLTGTYLAGQQLDVTLNWFVNRGIDLLTNETLEQSFQNLDLQVWKTLAGAPVSLVAQSMSQYNNVEHLYFGLPSDGQYMLRVLWAGQNWNLSGDSQVTEYGLAWSVPEPTSVWLAVCGCVALALASRRKRR